jgi:hypothetical protein
MGIDDAEGGLLLMQIGENTHQHDVLDDVGKATGVEGVTVVHGRGLRRLAAKATPNHAVKITARQMSFRGARSNSGLPEFSLQQSKSATADWMANPQSRDSGSMRKPVIGPRFARTRWHRPGMTSQLDGCYDPDSGMPLLGECSRLAFRSKTL